MQDAELNIIYKKIKAKRKTIRIIFKQRYLVLMCIPFVIWLIIFKYIPLSGWIMAFQDYKPRANMGIFDQPWVGLKHFRTLFQDPQFFRAMRNTIGMSLIEMIIGFPLPIIFALLLNEVRNIKFKRVVQTISYLPHFVSWVIVAGLVTKMLSTNGGIINDVLVNLRIIDKPIQFMAVPQYFWWICSFTGIWKELGWNSILFLAAIAGIDSALYEAATIDGAGRWRKMWHVTLPGIRSTIVVVLVLCVGWMISIGFEKQFLLSNSVVKEYAEVLDLYTLNYGIGLARYSYGTAIGIFQSLVSIILLVSANAVAKKIEGNSVI